MKRLRSTPDSQSSMQLSAESKSKAGRRHLHGVIRGVGQRCKQRAPDTHETANHAVVHEQIPAPLKRMAVLFAHWHARHSCTHLRSTHAVLKQVAAYFPKASANCNDLGWLRYA